MKFYFFFFSICCDSPEVAEAAAAFEGYSRQTRSWHIMPHSRREEVLIG